MRILIVEEEQELSAHIKHWLEDESGYAVDMAYTGQDGLDWAEAAPYDVIILDVILAKMDGLTVCRELRRRKNHTPILMLTACDAIDDRVAGLDAGADDYLVKPFAFKEFLARLRALMRRESRNKSGNIIIADLRLDPSTHYVRRNDSVLDLADREYALLEYLMRNPNRLITREMIIAHLWNSDHVIASNVVDVYLCRLRAKVDHPYMNKLIETIRGVGYRLRDPERSE